jgi:multimeric flavodoxin WrbA
MALKKVVLLDGSPAGDGSLPPLLALLVGVLEEQGSQVETFALREIRLAHCIGCFGCWLETPGVCIQADEGRRITEAVVKSDLTVLFTPVSFGGYSSELKKAIDRWLPLELPFFTLRHGEIHHTARYQNYPRLVGIGVQNEPNAGEAAIFLAVVGRNAINFHAGSYAADVVVASASPDALRERFRTVLLRRDAPCDSDAVKLLAPGSAAAASGTKACSGRKALLLVGSPKLKSPSTSGVLGNYLLDRLQERGWDGAALTLNAGLLKEAGEAELLGAVDAATLIILAFPLYIDALPFLVTRALERIAAGRRRAHARPGAQRLVVLCQNGFPEAQQNSLALAICRQFALQCGMIWEGGLAMGAGEALSSGVPLTGDARKGKPPAYHLVKALDLAGAALAEGHPVPAEAQKLISKCPIPWVPFAAWRWLFVLAGGLHWRQRAAGFGVGKQRMLDRPYETDKRRGDIPPVQ